MKDKMNKLLLTAWVSALLCCSCTMQNKQVGKEIWKSEIMETESAFAEMALKEGIPKAFLAFAAEDAVLMRNDRLIIGKDAIQNSFADQNPGAGQGSLSWKPDFVEVSSSGDLGYTYGKYVYTIADSLGDTQKTEGIFHTVWKRQDDGKWRFVWD